MVAADVIRSDWRRGFLFCSLSESESDTMQMKSETRNNGVSRRLRNADGPAITRTNVMKMIEVVKLTRPRRPRFKHGEAI
jgi:hypothetical protein